MKVFRLGKDKIIEENITKDVNKFQTKKYIDDKVIKNARNIFRLKKKIKAE